MLEMSRKGDPSKYVRWASLLVPKGKATLVLSGNLPFTATVGNLDVTSAEAEKGKFRVEADLESTGEPIELTIVLVTANIGRGWEFSAAWKRGGREVLVSPSELAFPWMLPRSRRRPHPRPRSTCPAAIPSRGRSSSGRRRPSAPPATPWTGREVRSARRSTLSAART